MIIKKNNQKGFVASLAAIFILAFMLSLSMSVSAVILIRHRISENEFKSSQSYYAAEAGIEDSLWRLKNNPQIRELNYTINIDGFETYVQIPDIAAGSRAITSQGNFFNRVKKIRAVYSLGGESVSFYYGSQVGEGGLTMGNGSRIVGNVFSNGNVTGSGIIDNDLIVSGIGKSVANAHIMGNAMAYSCLNATIDGNLTYNVNGTESCAVTGSKTQTPDVIEPVPLPISQSLIDQWISEAEAGGPPIEGGVSVPNNGTITMGPRRINGDLTLGNGATFKLTGIVYVDGNIVTGNMQTQIKLDTSYGPLSGVLLASGTVFIGNKTVVSGSGQSGSYIMVFSTSTSDYAISVGNNAAGAIFYANAGGVVLSNGMTVTEVTGYKVTLNNNAVVEYESGLGNLFFSSGPTASFGVTSWEEVE